MQLSVSFTSYLLNSSFQVALVVQQVLNILNIYGKKCGFLWLCV